MLIPILNSRLPFPFRLSVICLQRTCHRGRSRKPNPHCSPNGYLGVCCHWIPSAHCVMEQTRWEKSPDQIRPGVLVCVFERLGGICVFCLPLWSIQSQTDISVDTGYSLISIWNSLASAFMAADKSKLKKFNSMCKQADACIVFHTISDIHVRFLNHQISVSGSVSKIPILVILY